MPKGIVTTIPRIILAHNRYYDLMQNLNIINEPGVTDEQVAERQVTVSFSTFGMRLDWVEATIESIMEQTVKANRIVLWLDERRKKETKSTAHLIPLMDRGLEIRYCKDIGPATKLIPSLEAFPDDLIITIDDDALYDYDLIDRLLRTHRRHPDAVCANFCHGIKIDRHGNPVTLWEGDWKPEYGPDPLIVGQGVGGVLYPPGAFGPEVFDVKTMQRLAPKADDLWFKATQLLNGTPVVAAKDSDKIKDILLILEHHPSNLSLSTYNLEMNQNDVQLKNLFDHYDLYKFYS